MNARKYKKGNYIEAVWDASLTKDEINALKRRVSPLLIRPDKLIKYVPMVPKQ